MACLKPSLRRNRATVAQKARCPVPAKSLSSPMARYFSAFRVTFWGTLPGVFRTLMGRLTFADWPVPTAVRTQGTRWALLTQ